MRGCSLQMTAAVDVVDGRNQVVAPPSPVAKLPSSRVLFVTTNLWSSDYLLLRSLRRAGASVALLSPRGHPVRSTQLQGSFDLNPFRMGASLHHAIEAFFPELVVPGDERALRLIQRLHSSGTSAERRLVETSLGPATSFNLMLSRRENMEAARTAGLPVPDLISDMSRASLRSHLRSSRNGVVIKADNTWGGNGVRICRTLDEVDHATRELKRRPFIRALKRWTLDRDATLLATCLSGTASPLSAQGYLPEGRVGDLALFCRDGNVLGLTCAERETGVYDRGPSTIVRVVEQSALAEGACRFVRDQALSGFIGLDFIVDPASGQARVIEINPRATPLAGIRPLNGPSPAVAAAIELGAKPLFEESIFRQLIAYFPKAWQAHPGDVRLSACLADIPLDEPDLVDALLDQTQKQARGRFHRLRPVNTLNVQSRSTDLWSSEVTRSHRNDGNTV